MTAQLVPVYYAPDIDTSWSVSPGALTAINGFAPTQEGHYASIGGAALFAPTLTGVALKGRLFRQLDGSVRFLVFRTTDIDEYNNAGSKTNRATGKSANTTTWRAAQWGNQIIAVNYLDASLSSTGAGFTTLGGGAPKARHIAANLNFVLLGDIDDGAGYAFADAVQWSAMYNPNDWAPDPLATQCARKRIVTVPGPITNVTAFRDNFVVFKDNGLVMLQYTGPTNFVFAEVPISQRVGCIAPDSVVEMDGALYFLHTTGFWKFDGATLMPIGWPINRSMFTEYGLVNASAKSPILSGTYQNISNVRAIGDDVDGVVWWLNSYTQSGALGSTITGFTLYGFNTRSNKWARFNLGTGNSALVGASYTALVEGNVADLQAFKATPDARFVLLFNEDSGCSVQTMGYPLATTNRAQSTYTTGLYGSPDGAATITQHYWRLTYGSQADASMTVLTTGYSSEDQLTPNGSNIAGAINAEFNYADLRINSKYRQTKVTWSAGKKEVLAGIGFDGVVGGKR